MVLADKIINKPEALRRHVRFVAKLLQETGTEEIQATLDFMGNKHQQASAQQSKLEQLRDQLISDNSLLEQTLSEHDGLERQKLRQLVRMAGKEMKAEKPGKQCKALLAYLKEHIS